jgi:hypothetical protein
MIVAFRPITQTIQDLQAAPTEQRGNDPADDTANGLTVPKSRKRAAARRRKPRQPP